MPVLYLCNFGTGDNHSIMLKQDTLLFLTGLKRNNNKIWFDAHRGQYDLAREDFLNLVGTLIERIASFEAPIGSLAPKDCIFRINRDVRFSKDKQPYKTNLAAYFNKGGKKSNGAGYYLHIEPGNSFAAGGIWMPEPAILAGIRQEIDYNYGNWKKLIGGKVFKKMFPEGLTGEALSRPPRGYDEHNPAIGYIKMKNFIVSRPLPDVSVLNKKCASEITEIFRAMKPLIDFLNIAAEG